MPEQSDGFQIERRAADRGSIAYTLLIDDEALNLATYRLGSLEGRRKAVVSFYDSLCNLNGQTFDKKAIEASLAAHELAATRDLEEAPDEADEQGMAGAVVSYVDDELIVETAWDGDACATKYIVWDRLEKTFRECDEVAINQTVTIRPPMTGYLTDGGRKPGMVLLPSKADDHRADEKSIRADVRAFIDRYVQLPGEAALVATEYVMLSWIFEDFDEMPFMAFRTADYGRGKSRALETVGILCYRPIMANGGSTGAATIRVLDRFRGTLVCDEIDEQDTELASQITKIINTGFQKQRQFLKCEGEDNEVRPFNCYGPKLFALRKGFRDDATESRVISVWMTQRTRDVIINLPRAEFSAEALAIRNRLLYWRFQTLGCRKIDPSHASPALEDRQNQIGMPLMAVARTAKARELIVNALREQQSRLREDQADSLVGHIFTVVLELGGTGNIVRPRDVAKKMNERQALDEGIDVDRLRRPVTAHRVGRVMKKDLELTRGEDNKTAFYKLTASRRDQLCRRFGVDVDEHGHTATNATNTTNSTIADSGPETLFSDGGVSVAFDRNTTQTPRPEIADSEPPEPIRGDSGDSGVSRETGGSEQAPDDDCPF